MNKMKYTDWEKLPNGWDWRREPSSMRVIGLRGAKTTEASAGTPDMTSGRVVTVERPLGTHQMTSRSLETLQTTSRTMETASGLSGTLKTTSGSLGTTPDDIRIVRNAQTTQDR